MRRLTAIALLFSATAFGDAYLDRFHAANAAYQSGEYAQAVHSYEQLVDADVAEPVVFYNLGNAYYRLGRLGPAIANYERALQLDPGFDAARENLGQALRDTRRNLSRPLPPAWEQTLLFWHYRVSFETARVLAVLFWLLCWGLLALRQWRRWKYLRRGAAAAAVLAVAFAGSAWMKAHPPALAVAARETVPVHYGQSDTETVRFELFAGDRVLVDAESGGWVRVATAGGERGWPRRDAFAFVGPPYDTPSLEQAAAGDSTAEDTAI